MTWIAAIASCAVLAACTAPTPPGAWQWDLPRGFPEPRVPDDNPMSQPKVDLGRRLFYDARLSGNQTQSCSSCHDQAHAFGDGRQTPIGSTGQSVRRNAMSLVNAAWNSVQTWANSTLLELEQQALVPMFGDRPVELGLAGMEAVLLDRLRAVAIYQGQFAAAFPGETDPFSIGNVARALAAFERTIISGRSPYDRFQAGDTRAISASAQRGMELTFSERLECHHCHSGFNLTNSYKDVDTAPEGFVHYFNTGLYNVDGQGGYPASDTGLVELTQQPKDMGRYRAPTLRNVGVTAPYMHDGSVATLEEVVDGYARGGRLIATGPDAGDGKLNPHKSVFVPGFAITPAERDDVVAFLRSLTDDELLTDPRLADPWR